MTLRYNLRFCILVILFLSLGFSTTSCNGNVATGIKSLKIATDFPLSGPDAGGAQPAENGSALAIFQNHDLGNGYTLDLVSKNDEAPDLSGPSETVGTANIRELINDPSVIAGVGPWNSGIAKVEIPLFNNYGLPFISSGNTNPGLTKSQYSKENDLDFALLHPAGKPDNYFRIPGTSDVLGKLVAKLAAFPPSLGGSSAKAAFVIDDATTYGIGVANYMSNAFQANGGAILGRQSVTPETVEGLLPSIIAAIVKTHPDIVFYGGESGMGGASVKKALANIGLGSLPFYGGDGIADDPSWTNLATPAAAINSIALNPGPDVSRLSSTALLNFVKAYQKQFPNQLITSFTLFGYDAAMIEITVIKQLIAAGKPVTRANVRDGIAHINYAGLTGQISFDANGDNAGPKIYTVYQTDAEGNWDIVRLISG